MNERTKRKVKNLMELSQLIHKISGNRISKIAILISAFSRFEGASRVAEQQAKQLSEDGYLVSIFTFRADMSPPQGVKLEFVKPIISLYGFLAKVYYGLFPLNLIRIMICTLKLKDHDIIIVHHYNWLPLAYFNKLLYGTKIVVWVHRITGDFTSQNLIEKMYNKLTFPVWLWIMRRVECIVSISDFTKREITEVTGLESVIVYDIADMERFKEGLDGSFIRHKYGLTSEELVILYVGRVIPRKNVHLLIEVFRIVKRRAPNTRLIIVGKHYDEDYSRKLRKMIDGSIFFAKDVSDEELPYYYAACDIYATCSLFEGFNMPLIEAQMCGKPVIAFDAGPHREVIKRGVLVKSRKIEEFGRELELLLTHQMKIRKDSGIYAINNDVD